MMTKQDYINFWVDQAQDDWTAVDTLFKGQNYLQSLFFAHLVIEKQFTSSMLDSTNQLRLWLLERLQ